MEAPEGVTDVVAVGFEDAVVALVFVAREVVGALGVVIAVDAAVLPNVKDVAVVDCSPVEANKVGVVGVLDRVVQVGGVFRGRASSSSVSSEYLLFLFVPRLGLRL